MFRWFKDSTFWAELRILDSCPLLDVVLSPLDVF